MTRIVAGIARGRQLKVPAHGTRPTSDRVREALFSSLETMCDLDGVNVLDLYAGSGALGLEALSRGAGQALFIESDRKAAHIISDNARNLGFDNATVVPLPVERALANANIGATIRPCEVIFADPPYPVSNTDLTSVFELITTRGWAESGTIVVLERATGTPEPIWPAAFTSLKAKKYGGTMLYWARCD